MGQARTNHENNTTVATGMMRIDTPENQTKAGEAEMQKRACYSSSKALTPSPSWPGGRTEVAIIPAAASPEFPCETGTVADSSSTSRWTPISTTDLPRRGGAVAATAAAGGAVGRWGEEGGGHLRMGQVCFFQGVEGGGWMGKGSAGSPTEGGNSTQGANHR